MNRLSFQQKLLVLGSLVVIPLGTVLTFYLSDIGERIDFCKQEIHGTEALQTLSPMIQALAARRDLGCSPLMEATGVAADLVPRIDQQLNSAFARFKQAPLVQARLWSESNHAEYFERMLKSLPTQLTDRSSKDWRERHALAIAACTRLVTDVGDQSKLILDPELDTLYLTMVITNRLPELSAGLGGLCECFDLTLSVGDADRVDPESPREAATASNESSAETRQAVAERSERKTKLGMLLGQLEQTLQRLDHHLATVRRTSQFTDDSLLSEMKAHRETVARLLEALATNLRESSPPSWASAEAILRLGAVADQKTFALLDHCVRTLQVTLINRRAGFVVNRAVVLCITAIGLLVSAYLLFGFGHSLRQTVDALRESSRQALAGNIQAATLMAPAHDELGQIVEDFGRLMARLRLECQQAHAETRRVKAAEDQLRASEDRFQLAVSATADGIWDWDICTNRLYFSPRTLEMLGYAPGEPGPPMVWDTFVELLHPDDAEKTFANISAHLADGKKTDSEFRLRTKTGEYRWFLARGQAVWNDAGEAVRMAGSVSDITVARQIAAERARYLQEVETSRDWIAGQARDLHQKTIELDAARAKAEQAADAKSEFLANMSHELRTPLTAILGYAQLLQDGEVAVSDPQSRHEIIETIQTNGQHLLELINDVLDLSKLEAGRMTVEVVPFDPSSLLEDVRRLIGLKAEQKGLRLETIRSGRLPSAVLSDPTRLRQILVNLVGNAIKFTEQGTVRLGVEVVHGLRTRLILTVADSGIGMNDEQRQKLFQPFTQADSSMSRRFGGTGLGLSISQRLASLLDGEIRVSSVVGKGSTFTVEVATSIPEGAIWSQPTLSPPVSLGTAAALGSTPLTSMDHHARSDGPSHPPAEIIAQRPAQARGGGSATIPAVLDGARVLLAEDVPANQKLIAFILQKAGATVEVVGDGLQAHDRAWASLQEGQPFDLIVMDMQMPVMDGYTATERLRDAGYSGPIIAMTAHALEGDRDRCVNVGCTDYATKPIDRPAFLATCARWFQEHRRHADHLGGLVSAGLSASGTQGA